MWVGVIRFSAFETVEIEGNLEDYQRLVGGWLETVPTFIKGHLLLIDEEGKLKGLPLNDLATLCSAVCAPDFIVGDAVLVRLNANCDDWEGWESHEDCYRAFQAVLHAGFGGR